MESAMTDFALRATPASGLAARFGNAFGRAMTAFATRRALDHLPDDLLRDVGLTRSEIPYVADALARGRSDPTRDPQHYLNASVAKQRRAG